MIGEAIALFALVLFMMMGYEIITYMMPEAFEITEDEEE